MSESQEHPKRLWLVEDDREAGFRVREVDVEPVDPQQAPVRYARYHLTGKETWHTVSLELDAYRTKGEALGQAIAWADEAAYDWEQRADALREQRALALDEEVSTEATERAREPIIIVMKNHEEGEQSK